MRAVLIATILSLSACGSVDTGHRGIWVKFGEVIGEPVTEGLYFYNPFIWHLVEYPVREEKWSDTTEIFTRDTQRVTVDFTIIYHVDPSKAGVLFKEIGNPEALGTNILRPVVLGSLKDAIGQVIADNLVGEREKVTKRTLAVVIENLKTRHIEVTDLQFTNINFDKAYEQAVEQKVIATQDAQKAKNITVTIEEQAKQTVMTAKAEAQAMEIKSRALAQNKGLVQFEAVQKWDGKLPTYMFGSGTTPFIDIRSLKSDP